MVRLKLLERDAVPRRGRALGSVDDLVLREAADLLGMRKPDLQLQPARRVGQAARPRKRYVVLRSGARVHGFDFSVSHTAGYTAVATTVKGRVGVDIEPIIRPTVWREIAEIAFTECECAILSRCHGEEAALTATKLWTRKEAVVKALGVGIVMDLARLQVGPREDPARWPACVMVDGLSLRIGGFRPVRDMVGAVAVIAGPDSRITAARRAIS